VTTEYSETTRYDSHIWPPAALDGAQGRLSAPAYSVLIDTKEVAMTRITGQRRRMTGIALAIAAAALAAGTALAHGGYGPGHGMGCGAGYGPGGGQGCAAGNGPGAGGGPGCGAGTGPGACGAAAGSGLRQGMGGHGPGAGHGAILLTEEERTAHRAKMQSLASYDECKSYMADFSKQIQARAKEKGQTVGGPNEAMCDRMKAHGRFTQ
jgi:hypothetical protein